MRSLISRIGTLLLIMLCAGGAEAQLPVEKPTPPPPSAASSAFELGSARLRLGVARHRGSQQDLGPGLSYKGITPNDIALSGTFHGTSLFGGWISLQREGLSLFDGESRVAQGFLFRAHLAPALRFRVGALKLEGAAGYQYAQLPAFTSSATPTLDKAQRHALFAGLRARLPLSRYVSAELSAELPISLSAQDGAGGKAKSSGYAAGAAILFPLARLNRLAWGLAVDYQWVKDTLEADSGAKSDQMLHRFGVSIDLSFHEPLPPVLAMKAPEPPPEPPAPPPPPAPGLLKIVVKNKVTGVPVVSAAVKIGDVEGATDTEGRFQVEGLSAGPAQVAVTAKGFQPASEFASMSDGLDTELSVTLQPEGKKLPATLSGHVRSRQFGTPVQATLEISNTQHRTQTNERGAFNVQVEAGTYRVKISAPGFRTQTKSVTLREGEQAIFNVDMSPQAK